MSYELRRGTSDDSPGIFEVQVDAFNVPADSPRRERIRAEAFDRPHEHIVMVEEGGRVLGVVHIGDDRIQVGRCVVRKADVGHVSIRAELQGQGLGTRMMRWTVAHLREQGYHLSRLGGLVHFYSRFGYEPFPRRFVEMRPSEVRGGQRRIPATEVYPEPTGLPGTLRPYDESRDFADRVRLRYEFHFGRSGTWEVSPEATPPPHPAGPDPEGLAWVYERDGAVRGFVIAEESPLEARGDERVFSISDFAYDPAYPDAAGAVIRKLLARIAQYEPVRVTSRLPFDQALMEALTAANVGFELREMHQAVASNMILVLDLAATLRAVGPELSARLQDSLVTDWEGELAMTLLRGGGRASRAPSQAITPDVCRLVIAGGEMRVAEDGGSADLALELTQAQFVKALFGIAALTELPAARTLGLSARERGLLDALFPRTQTGSGPWG